MLVTALTAVAFLWCYREPVGVFLTFVKDRDAVTAYLHQLGPLGPLVMVFLSSLQVVLGSISGEILLISGGYVYGFWMAFALNLVAIVGTSQLVFGLSRWLGRPFVTRAVSEATLNRWMALAEEKGMLFFFLAIITPIVPGDLMNYVAGLTTLSGWRFLLVNVCGRVLGILLLTLIGATGLQFTPAFLSGLVVFGLLLLVAWWQLIIKTSLPTT